MSQPIALNTDQLNVVGNERAMAIATLTVCRCSAFSNRAAFN
ncbi:hypothetical protein [Oculatella sp. LEGE 06141]|nr:hypothetical protein [Oculatella sp. LEGE 06141]